MAQQHPQQQCQHPEAFVSGVEDDYGQPSSIHVLGHDCDYVDARNSLIEFAEAKANRLVGWTTPKGTEQERAVWNDRWNRAFFAEMDRMWAARCAGVVAQRQAA